MSFTIRRSASKPVLASPSVLKVVGNGNPLPFEVSKRETSLDKVLITPEMAQYLLDNHNGRNRPVKQTRVDAYTMELKLGKWKYNGEHPV